ncbi:MULTISPECIES: hypothetical protein [unclassified Nocardiopsis]|uniref:hypothetical protein n=1 Tax=unclassified Nocardiopsis TaxID=2649073 RepID=UPI0033F20EC1
MADTPPGSSPGLALAAAILTFLCCNLIGGVLGIIFASVAVGKTDEADRDRFVGYAWLSIIFGTVFSFIVYLYFLSL